MKRIKLLYISQATGGVKRHITLLAGGLDQSRFEVVGCFPPRDRVKGVNPKKESFFDAFRKLGLRAIPLDMHREIRPFQDLLAFVKLYFLLKREKWDIVHTHSSKAGFLGRLAARLAGVPVIIHTPNAFVFDRPPHSALNGFYIFLERWAGLFCDALIAVSPSEEELARQVVPRKKIVQIPNGVDLKEFDFQIDPTKKKESLGISGERPVVVTIGRLTAQKAPGIFVEAEKRILRKRRDVAFVVVGDGPLFSKVKRGIEKEGLSESIFLLNWRSDAKEILASCDVYVLSSLWEGLPYTVLEAMALQKPVVATAARGTRDVVREGVSGFLVPLRGSEEMAEGILKLLSDKDLAARMGKAGRAIVEEEYTLEPKIEKVTSLYLSLLKRKGFHVS